MGADGRGTGAPGRDHRRIMRSSLRAVISAREAITMGQMKEFAGLFYREGSLDPKTMQLVALAAMAAAGCTS